MLTICQHTSQQTSLFLSGSLLISVCGRAVPGRPLTHGDCIAAGCHAALQWLAVSLALAAARALLLWLTVNACKR